MHVWDCEFEKLWGFKVVIVAQQWRQSQAQAKQEKARATEQQQQQRQQGLYREDASNSPTSSHSSPMAVKLQAQPYEGRWDGNSQPLLHLDDSMSNLDAAGALASQSRLPSLKQTGLLDLLNAKEPFETCVATLSLRVQNPS